MFCTKCGKQVADDAKVCEFCGAQLGAENEASVGETINEAVNNIKEKVEGNPDLKRIILGLAAVLVLLVLALICNGIFGSSPKKSVKNFLKAQIEYDAKDLYKYSIRNKTAQKKLDIYDEDDYEDEYEDALDSYEEIRENMEDEEIEYKYKIDVKEVEKFGKKDDEFEWVQEYLDDMGADADALKKVASVKVRTKVVEYVDGDKEDSNTDTNEYVAVKLGSKWYCIPYATLELLEERYD